MKNQFRYFNYRLQAARKTKMSGLITEHQRLKMVAKLQQKQARQMQSLKDTEAELGYWANLELPLEKKGPAK